MLYVILVLNRIFFYLKYYNIEIYKIYKIDFVFFIINLKIKSLLIKVVMYEIDEIM